MKRPSASEAFRRGHGRRVVAGIAASAALHALLFYLLSPDLHFDRYAADARSLRLVDLETPAERALPQVTAPPPPEPLVRPAPPRTPGPPGPEPSQEPTYIPHDTPPRLLNPSAVQDYLLEAVPDSLVTDFAERTVELWMYLDRGGKVTKAAVRESSGLPTFDRLVTDAVSVMDFRPALNGGQPTPVWVAQKIRFTVEDTASGDGQRTRGEATSPPAEARRDTAGQTSLSTTAW